MALALPGGTYLYQGEELAVPEVRDIPENRLTDPRWKMSSYKDRGRDGCRVPIPWKTSPHGAFGFSSRDSLTPDEAWLPASSWWGQYSAESQENDPNSTLNIYRRALAIRKNEAGLGDGPMEWINTRKDVVAFSRPGNFACYINFGADYQLPAGSEVLVASGPLKDGLLPTDTAVWVRVK
jgi:alpha-glucosidase